LKLKPKRRSIKLSFRIITGKTRARKLINLQLLEAEIEMQE